jgi:NADPH:quinone reductase
MERASSSMLSKRLTVRGTVLRARTLDEKIQATRLFAQEVVPLLVQRVLRPAIDSTFKLADIAKAHAHVESNQNVGKVLIEMD